MTTLADLRWPRHTARLTLRPMTTGDRDTVHAYRRLPAVAEWLPSDGTDLAYFTERYFGEKLGDFLVVERDGVIVGDVMIRLGDGWAQREVAPAATRAEAEIGYAFDPGVAGQGYATEAAAEALAVCFGELGVRRVTAQLFAGNEPSRRVLERIGMRGEGHGRADSLHRTRGWVDGLSYALLAEEWVPPATR